MEENEIIFLPMPKLADAKVLKSFLETLLQNFKTSRNAIAAANPERGNIVSAYIKIEDFQTTITNKMGAIYINEEKIFVCTDNISNTNWEQEIYQGLIDGILTIFLTTEAGRRFGSNKV